MSLLIIRIAAIFIPCEGKSGIDFMVNEAYQGNLHQMANLIDVKGTKILSFNSLYFLFSPCQVSGDFCQQNH